MNGVIQILVIALLVTIIVLVRRHDKKKEQEDEERDRIRRRNREQWREKQEAEYNTQRTKLIDRLGECVLDIDLGGYEEYDINTHVMLFESSQIIRIKAQEYKFSDILGYSLVDDATSETITTSTGTAKTSTGSMLGRAVVGGVLTGGLGAVAGAATAKKNISDNATSQTTTMHNYTLYINVNSLQEPTISLNLGSDVSIAQKLAGAVNVIIERNNE